MNKVSPTLPSAQTNGFELRRLHNLLLFYEHGRNKREKRRAAGSVARHLRLYLSEFHDLHARDG